MRDRYDVVVVGAGPGGALTALMLAQRGRKVAIVDRELFPRFAIGESSTPIASRVIEQIADDYGVPEIRSLATWGQWQENLPDVTGGLKRGFTYVDHRTQGEPLAGFHWPGFDWPGSDCPESEMDTSRRLLVAASSSDAVGDTHWVRAEVDAFLLDCCRRRGVTVMLQHEVVSVSNDSPWSVAIRSTDEQVEPRGFSESVIVCAHLVDATGRSGVLLRKMGCVDVTDSMQTNTAGRWSHVTGLPPFEISLGSSAPYLPCAAAVHHLVDGGWVWQLPMSDGRTSVGRVWKSTSTNQPAATSSEVASSLDIAEHVELARYLDTAKLADTPGQWFSGGRIQHRYRTDRKWSLAMLPLPTTVATIDPLHSTGLAHAISGAQRVADLIVRNASSEVFRYQRQVDAEVSLLDRVVGLAYRSMENREAFFAACMLYFAIAIRDEEDRVQNGYRVDRTSWFADQTEVAEVVSRVEDLLVSSTGASRRLDQQAIHHNLQAICHVPLACRDDNVYAYTFA